MSDEHDGQPAQPAKPPILGNPEINFFGMTNFRNQGRKFGIKIDDRRRHMYVVGKTGMGKTTILENMVLNDIYAGHGIGLVDPHGDFAEKIIDFIPANRINDVVYFNPADINYPIGFNILETVNPEHRHLVASGLMGVFKKIWPDVWSARMEYILNNTILALLEYPGTTLLGINRLLAEEDYRKRVVAVLKDPVVKGFWVGEFANYTDKFRTEAVAPIQNKIGQFLSASVIRNIVAQVKSRINIREIMDTKKIFIMNLSKGRIGEDNSRLLGGMLITKLQLAAMERVDIPEKDRKDFFLYVDEFQNFATESFANILSEARKYRLDLIMAHQYMEQLEEEVLAAVIGNVGTMVTFRVGSSDAEILAKEFAPTFVEEDLINLPKFQTYLKLMIDGVASRPFSAQTLPPIGSSTASTEKVVRVSRERYATPREKIEDKIMRWSGFLPAGADPESLDDDDEPVFARAGEPQESVFKKPEPAPAPKPVEQRPPMQPQPKPAQSFQAQQPAKQPQPSNRSNGQPGQPGQPGSGKNKKKKKKSGGGGGNNPPPGVNAERVVLVDPSQKGMSLSGLAAKSAPSPAPLTPAPRMEQPATKPVTAPVMQLQQPTPGMPPSQPPVAIEPPPVPAPKQLPAASLGFVSDQPAARQPAPPASIVQSSTVPPPAPKNPFRAPMAPPRAPGMPPKTVKPGEVVSIDE